MNIKQNSGIRLATSTDHTYIHTNIHCRIPETNKDSIYMHETWKSNEKVRTLKVHTYIQTDI